MTWPPAPGPGATSTPEQLARLAEPDADASAGVHLQRQRNANTARAYERDWTTWAESCAAVGIPEVPATRGRVTAFVRWRWLAGHAPGTIERNLSVISDGHTQRGVQIDRAATRHGRAVLDAEVRTEAEQGLPPRGRGKAPAVTVDRLERMLLACPDTMDGDRDQALLLVGLGIPARRDELSALRTRNIEDLDAHLRATPLFGKRGGRTVPRTVTVTDRETHPGHRRPGRMDPTTAARSSAASASDELIENATIGIGL
ncbi:hypothetical protein [Actinomadura sp. 9N215]|uniref:hypothetical protein n=1 Tax=Actinomadura sp. 9N215 TaxID=3375150 RepID=UPI00378BBD26